MPAISVAGDVDVFDFTERLVITQDGVNQVPTALRRPMSHSGARALQQFVSFAAGDEVFHVNASELADPLAFNGTATLHDQYGQRYTVVTFELQTAMTRLVVVARRAIDEDLVVWYPLDETTGTVIANKAGNDVGNLISLDFSADSVAGPVGSRGVRVPTASDYLRAGFDADYANVNPITVAFWAKLVAPTLPSRKLVSFGYLEIIANDEVLHVTQAFDSAIGSWSAPGAISMDAWHHLAVVYGNALAADDPLLYVDGAEVTLSEDQTPVGTILDDTLVLKLFGFNGSAPALQFDDIRVYNRELTELEIEALYLLGSP